jgi:DNA-binding NtrC family response regulator
MNPTPAPPDVGFEDVWQSVNKVTPRVLVVDDESLIRWSVAETLAGRRIRAIQASDGASAIRLIATESQPFEVVVLDLRLPDVSDLSLLAKVRELSPASRVIIMTAFGSADVAARAVELGAMKIVHKPFELDDLAALVEAALLSSGTSDC